MDHRLVLLPFVLALALTARAQVPETTSYQGHLTGTDGTALTGRYTFTFRLFAEPSGGTPLWSERHPDVLVDGGSFAVLLGSKVAFTEAGVGFDAPYYLELEVDDGSGAVVLAPRQVLASVPYAQALRGLRVQPNAGSPNLIGGYAGNEVAVGVAGATIGGGGGSNWINRAGGNYATVSGGARNRAVAEHATVSGGYNNEARGLGATVGGGFQSTATGQFATVSGGAVNTAAGRQSTVPGGQHNRAEGDNSFAAGSQAHALHEGSFVWSDRSVVHADSALATTAPNQFLIRALGGVGIGTNTPTSPLTVAGTIESRTGGFKFPDGSVQTTAATGAAGWGLSGNAGTTPETDFIGTTDAAPLEFRVDNVRALRIAPASVAPNLIGGHAGNRVAEGVDGAAIGGGGRSGRENIIGDDFGTIGGGASNRVGEEDDGQSAGADYGTVGGGYRNTASYRAATVSGGEENEASGRAATVPGGEENEASGSYSFAAGRQARALHERTFVWNGASSGAFASTGSNQFLIRAPGGVGIGTDEPAAVLHVKPEGATAGLRVEGRASIDGNVSIGGNTVVAGNAEVEGGLQVNGHSLSIRAASGQNARLYFAEGGSNEWSFQHEGGTSNAELRIYSHRGSAQRQALTLRDTYETQGASGSIQILAGGDLRPLVSLGASLGHANTFWSHAYISQATFHVLPVILSDARQKRDVQPLAYGLREVMRLRPVSYRLNDLQEAGAQFGLLAQEVEAVVPEVVARPEGPDDPYSLSYTALVPVLIKAVQEQQATIKALTAPLEALQAAVDAVQEQQATIEALTARLEALQAAVDAGAVGR